MRVVRVLGALATLVALGSCGPSTPPAPSVNDFKAGSCRQVAAEVLDVASMTSAVSQGQKSAAAAEDPLTADQGHLKSTVEQLADPSVQQQVRTVIIDIGFFRFTVDHHTFDGSQNKGLAKDAGAIESACITSHPATGS
ncbi:MAG: hypothetical protein JF887_07070 [Candidatus Dormibacteraeota bacterium]|uniref:Lipoprotein n=1 Tax=Candidatus Amunia macphersoniae TaxID=3127014 RepID=A0A934KEU9_9BACT|nr:hypothetical protein [Candidatus Dormibacteraeota bacterium]